MTNERWISCFDIDSYIFSRLCDLFSHKKSKRAIMPLIKNPNWDPSPTQHALNIAKRYANIETTTGQNAWIIDQMVRALTCSPLETKEFMTTMGEVIQIEILGESREYQAISDAPNWDRGIPI
jgi:hypothetical protein